MYIITAKIEKDKTAELIVIVVNLYLQLQIILNEIKQNLKYHPVWEGLYQNCLVGIL